MNFMTAAVLLALQWAFVSGAVLFGGAPDLPLAAVVIAGMYSAGGAWNHRLWALGLAVDLFSPCPTGLHALLYLLVAFGARWAGSRFDPSSAGVRAAAVACAAVFVRAAEIGAAAAQGAAVDLSYFTLSVASTALLTVLVGFAAWVVFDACRGRIAVGGAVY